MSIIWITTKTVYAKQYPKLKKTSRKIGLHVNK